jgi:hypothetical protein
LSCLALLFLSSFLSPVPSIFSIFIDFLQRLVRCVQSLAITENRDFPSSSFLDIQGIPLS